MEIKAMTVNGKQVTLAVFRQLYDEPLYDFYTWQAVGTPWCRVNYHPDRCDRDSIVHEHVVWQKGDELRRARVDRPSGKVDAVPRFDKRPDDEAAICVAADRISNAWITSVKGTPSYSRTPRSAVEKPVAYVTGEFDEGRQVTAKLYLSSPEVASIVKGYGSQPHPSLHGEHERLHPDEQGCRRVAGFLGQRLVQTETWLRQSQDRWNEVRELPQVFIAL
ncbi:UNVERIFIED_ORG: hypothetical protein FHR35_004508 [Microbispora rosea subsp. rosea]